MTGAKTRPKTGPGIYDLAVIGAGLSGLAAALFAARRGLLVVHFGPSGCLSLNSGLVDLLGVHPSAAGKWLDDPWVGIRSLNRQKTAHPYSALSESSIRRALEIFLAECGLAGLEYRHQQTNSLIATGLGTLKPTWALPASMWPGVEALEKGRPSLIIGFNGLREFSARQFAANLGSLWPGLSHGRVDFPGNTPGPHWLAGEVAAMALDSPSARHQLADSIRPLLGENRASSEQIRAVGLPALVGMGRHAEAMADLSARLERPVFEIPIMPPSAPGVRLQNALENRLRVLGVRRVQHRVTKVDIGPDRPGPVNLITIEGAEPIPVRRVILASGRFSGGGLNATSQTVRETIFDLPVSQPSTRSRWHGQTFLPAQGHPVNRAGLVIDSRFQPLDGNFRIVQPHLQAVGSILAGVDWMRTKCGAGTSISSAYGAVDYLVRSLRNSEPGNRSPNNTDETRPSASAPVKEQPGGTGKVGNLGILLTGRSFDES